MRKLIALLLVAVPLCAQTRVAPFYTVAEPPGPGTVAVVDTARLDSAALGFPNEMTMTITLSSVTNGYLTAVLIAPAGTSHDGLTVGGSAATLIDTAKYTVGGDVYISVWGYPNPGSGSKTVVANFGSTGGAGASMFVMHLEHVDQSTPYVSGLWKSGFASALADTIAVTTNDLGFSSTRHTSSTSFTAGGDLDKLMDNYAVIPHAIGTATGNGDLPLSWTASGAQVMVMVSGTFKHD